jgi:phospholipid/cholesterol/gamma-HCH transport system substrate-binding protein
VPGDGTAHFGLVLNVDDPPACTKGYEGTKRLDPNQTTDLPALNTAARCDEPRGSVTAVRGAQNAPTGGSGAATAARPASAPGAQPDVRTTTPPPGVPDLTWLLTGALS